ncbi:transferase [Streptomyces sp. NBC_00566]|uniref:transferase n=1 Tax=Streptomyces sp. NBC_00566 TaxID=2975778 RepID=UPI002E8143E4|nr:transferase [Streptomyces sp. NBC_00566]WUB85316.1 transferase [Streptomyces sp. NBC_00566]
MSTTSDKETRVIRVTCVADADGRVTFHLPLPEPDGSPHLLLRARPRKGLPDPAERRLPLAAGGDGRARAVLEPLPPLEEGRWDAFLVREQGAEPERLASGPLDLRVLVDGARVDRPSPVAARIPYRALDGFLAVRAWLRTAHAETDRIEVGDRATAVTARLHGASFGEGALVRLRGRGSDAERTVRPDTDADGRGFRCTVDHAELIGGDGADVRYWDVEVLPAAGAAAIRVGRVLDDVADRKQSFVYPAASAGGRHVRPYYTVDNDLSFEVTAPS